MGFSERVTALRKQAGWSQEELAQRLDVSRQAVSKWESGQAMPDLDRVVQYVVLNCTTCVIVQVNLHVFVRSYQHVKQLLLNKQWTELKNAPLGAFFIELLIA